MSEARGGRRMPAYEVGGFELKSVSDGRHEGSKAQERVEQRGVIRRQE